MLSHRIMIPILYLFIFCGSAYASVQNNYHFSQPLQEQRFVKLLSELRCLVCQNQSLAESNAPLAMDLKQEVYRQVLLGFTDEQIKHYLVERYGDYILFRPEMNETTLLLWLGPLLFLVGGFCILILSIKRNQLTTSSLNVS